MMIRVIVESPYRGDVDANTMYLIRALKDCNKRNESPYASHLICPFYLNENDPAERQRGILAGYVWIQVAQKQVFYTDLGWSDGMRKAWAAGQKFGISQELRALDGKVIEP
jgi:hypothetical protein